MGSSIDGAEDSLINEGGVAGGELDAVDAPDWEMDMRLSRESGRSSS
jgi:hypothetical protein